MTHHIVRHDAPCLFLLLNWTSLNTVTMHQLVRHDGLHMSVMTPDSASWRTIQNYFVCPIQGLIRGFRHDAQHVASRRTTLVRHNARACVMADHAKTIFLNFQKLIQILPSWRLVLPSRRTILIRHDARLCVMTHCTKQFCPDCQ